MCPSYIGVRRSAQVRRGAGHTGAVATATFNAVGESLMVQWTGTDGWAVIGHGTGATGDMGTGPTLS